MASVSRNAPRAFAASSSARSDRRRAGRAPELRLSAWTCCAPRAVAWLALVCVALLPLRAAAQEVGTEAGTAVYVRTDSDSTTVIAPRLHVAAPVADATRVDVVYTMDVWTSASIDIRASASKPITEQRDEMHVQVAHDWDAMSLSGAYRYSKEPDYESHGGTLSVSRDFADKSATANLELNALFDTVGRAGDPGFARAARNLSARLAFTQILDQRTLVQGIYELSQAHGYLSSPYRFVGIQGTDNFCHADTPASAMYCIPEANPESRLRHAAALRGRRALGKHFSVGLGYRFYIDDWSLISHTAMAEVSFLPEPDTVLSLRYRFYLQSAASQYASRYQSDTLTFYTNDKKLSPFMAHHVALDLEHVFQLDPTKRLRLMLSVAPSLYLYSDFIPLSQIRALEVSLATVLQL